MAALSGARMEVVKKPDFGPAMEAKKTSQKARTSSISFSGQKSFDLHQVLRYPIMTESAVAMMEKDNTLAFVVDARADKKMIRGAMKGLLGVEAKRVNTLVRPDGSKKAYVKLAPGYAAADVANKMGMF